METIFLRRKCFWLLLFSLISFNCFSQKLALKTNLAQWATVSPNLGAEFVLNSHFTLDLSASFNVWTPVSSFDLKHVLIQPELRYWFGRPMARHFVGITAFYADYDVLLKHKNYYGNAYAGGLTYGYAWVLGRHWNLEVTAGVGALYKRQFKYGENEVRPVSINDTGWLVAPVKLGVSFVYIIR